MPINHDSRDGLAADARTLARGTYILGFLRREDILSRNPHLILGFADTLLRSLRGLKLDAWPR